MNQFQLALKHSIEQNEDMVQAAANNLLRSAAQGEEWAIVELARQVSLLGLFKERKTNWPLAPKNWQSPFTDDEVSSLNTL